MLYLILSVCPLNILVQLIKIVATTQHNLSQSYKILTAFISHRS